MILDEAIKHAEEVAEEKSNLAARIRDNMKSEIALSNADECETCADEHRQLAEWLKDYKQLKEQQSNEDCVSRQAIDQNIYDYAESNGLSYVNMKNYILDTPSVTPTQKVGKWLVNKEKDTICCPFCNDKQKIGKDEVELLNTAFARFNFCTYCGAEMESE